MIAAVGISGVYMYYIKGPKKMRKCFVNAAQTPINMMV